MLLTDVKVKEKHALVKVKDTASKETVRSCKIIIGNEYECQPLNKLKLKHRGRSFVVTGFTDDKVKVKFNDTLRAGTVLYEEVVEINN